MIDLTGTNNTPKTPTVVAVGLFDGLHIGHRMVIKTACGLTLNDSDLAPAVFTFETNTVTTKHDGSKGFIISHELKHELISELGVEYIYSPNFTDFRNMSADEFTRLVLCEKLHAKHVVCGEDFRFGKGAAADVNVLDKLCAEHDIKLTIVLQVVNDDGVRISSTMVRDMIKCGDIVTANKLLGYHYQIKMPVAYGKQLGRTIDFPTINQYFPEMQIVPRFGVYASMVEYNGVVYKGMTNVGVKPTVQNSDTPLCETYIIGFDGEIYGETVKLSLVKFIRPERKFDSLKELSEQINKDKIECDNVSDELY